MYLLRFAELKGKAYPVVEFDSLKNSLRSSFFLILIPVTFRVRLVVAASSKLTVI